MGGGADGDSGLACIALLAQLHGVAADPAQLRHALGLSGPATSDDLLQAAGRLQLKARTGPLDLERAADGRLPLPCIIGLLPVATDDAATASEAGFAILAAVVNGQAMLHDPIEGRREMLALDTLKRRLTGAAIFVTSRAQLAAELARFDFSWFVPAIVKYRSLLSEALVASLFIQIFALLTPLFFQVVMDKVLVHKGISTLTVISLGLLAVVIFESLLSALRNYVFAHTTSRIDVELGAQLFRHLLALPLAYFEARRVGDSVARVRELENIRQFLTGQALTSVIDLAFTVVFLAVMLYYSRVPSS